MLSLRWRLLEYAVFVGLATKRSSEKFISFLFSCHLRYAFFRLKCILKQSLDSVFVICELLMSELPRH